MRNYLIKLTEKQVHDLLSNRISLMKPVTDDIRQRFNETVEERAIRKIRDMKTEDIETLIIVLKNMIKI